MSRGKGGLARAVTPLLHKASQDSAGPLPDAFVFESVDGPRTLDIPADVVSWILDFAHISHGRPIVAELHLGDKLASQGFGICTGMEL